MSLYLLFTAMFIKVLQRC